MKPSTQHVKLNYITVGVKNSVEDTQYYRKFNLNSEKYDKQNAYRGENC